jgi:hypothetical protein
MTAHSPDTVDDFQRVSTGAARQLSELRRQVAALTLEVERTSARGQIENAFARYQYLHCAFRDEEIITSLWVRPGTTGISAQYTNAGVYTTWESVMEYHRNRPNPAGKLLVHYLASPLIEVAEDGETAKGTWIVAGIECGISDPTVAAQAPQSFFEAGTVNGKRAWTHWIMCRYAIDFLKQDGEWRIWHFRCVEICRAPFGSNWIEFAAQMQANATTHPLHNALAFFGEDGRPVFMPPIDAPPKSTAYSYQTDRSSEIEPPLPEPFRTFSETFEY